MTTPLGKARVLRRINNRNTRAELAKLRDNIGIDYANDPDIKTAFLVKEKELTR